MAENVKNNNLSWILGITFGLVGALVSAAIYVYIAYKIHIIFSLVAILCGIIAGGAMALGFMLGKGKLTQKNVSLYLWATTILGAIGVLAAYFLPYVIYFRFLSLSFYLTLIKFGFLDVLFIVFGAFGGRWAGQKVGYMMFHSQLSEQALEEFKKLKSEPKKSNKA
jgi:hypothetical protein